MKPSGPVVVLRCAMSALVFAAGSAAAQVPPPVVLPPSVTVTSVVTTNVPNDRRCARKPKTQAPPRRQARQMLSSPER